MTAPTIIGCSSNRYVVLTPTTMRLGNYTVLEVEKFGSNLQDSDALGVAGKMPALIVEKIRKYNLNHSDAKLFSRVILSTDSDVDSTGVVLMKGVLLSYETGNRAKRWLLGLGSGKAYCTLQCTFVDKTTGLEVLKVNFEGELGGGFFGGGAEGASKAVVSSITNYLKRHYQP